MRTQSDRASADLCVGTTASARPLTLSAGEPQYTSARVPGSASPIFRTVAQVIRDRAAIAGHVNTRPGRDVCKAIMRFTIAFALAALAGTGAVGFESGIQPPAQSAAPAVVHEWGTFTSIAGPAGRAMEWTPQAGQSDLPCFVARNRFNI